MGLFILSVAISLTVPAKLPDPKLTPGRTTGHVTQANIHSTICRAGYAQSVPKPPQNVLVGIFHEYEVPPEAEPAYEMDRLIPLELGGSNTASNLWPQPYCRTPEELAVLRRVGLPIESCFGAREKNEVETTFRRRVCAGQMALREAQQRIAANWYAEYVLIKAGK